VSDDRRRIVVLAGVIEHDGKFLLTRRLKHTHLAGFWEFPGGKCEPDESHEACLIRELHEELGVSTVVGEEILISEHDYADRTVRIHFRRCDIAGDPSPQLGQEMRWVARSELATLQLPPADDALIALLINQPDR
jgi:mutator protein MutT